MEKIKGFKNSWILTEDGLVKTNLIIKEGKILSIGDNTEEGLIELDDQKIVIPGLIDQHIHGASGSDAIDGKEESIYKMACALPQEGITAFLPTTTNQSIEVIDKSLMSIKKYMDNDYEEGAQVLGAHLEGPFISRKYVGAQIPEYILKPNVDKFKHFEEMSRNTIKLATIAVEEEGAEELINYLKSKNIVISIGHSSAGFEDVKKAVEMGVTCITHTYNGMKPLRRNDIGMVGSTMYFDELYAEAICDGIHISQPAVKLLWKAKPSDKLILVSDALRTKFMPEGRYEDLEGVIILKDKAARLEDGTLAGSVLQINDAIKNIMDFTGVDFITAVKYATENPAKNLGVFDIMGSIKENKLANFVIVDKDLQVYQTIRNGKIIYQK